MSMKRGHLARYNSLAVEIQRLSESWRETEACHYERTGKVVSEDTASLTVETLAYC